MTFAGCGSGGGTSGTGHDEDGGGDATGETPDGASADGTTPQDGQGPGGGDATVDTGAPTDSGSTGMTDSGATVTDSGTTVGDGGEPSDASLSPDAIFGGGGTCVTLGSGCTTSAECCTGVCAGNVCAFPTCQSTGGACTSDSQCCGLTCTGGACASVNGGACTTLGNTCSANADCCSGRCSLGSCQPSSWCAQTNDICATGADCCSGQCTIPAGKSVGACALQPAGGNCKQVDGQLCTPVSFADGGCGGSCCSRACAPWGPTGIDVCQPATGCHVEWDTCTTDSDCCGAAAFADAGLPTSQNPVVCLNGFCQQHMGCTPAGDVCKLMTTSCNANQDCCGALGNKNTSCRQDNVGVPRCSVAVCVDPGGACATSADCCNGNPCTPNPSGNPPFTCAQAECVPSCSTCSTSADCCPGLSCIGGKCDPCGGGSPGDGGAPADGGSATPDGGGSSDAGGGGPSDGGGPGGGDSGTPPPMCSSFGQLCGDAGLACCIGLHCTNDRCELN